MYLHIDIYTYLYVYLHRQIKIKIMNTKTKAPYLEKEWIETSEKIKALAHPIRLYIIALLKTQKEMNVTELQEALNLEQAVVSHHLNILKKQKCFELPQRRKKYVLFIKK